MKIKNIRNPNTGENIPVKVYTENEKRKIIKQLIPLYMIKLSCIIDVDSAVISTLEELLNDNKPYNDITDKDYLYNHNLSNIRQESGKELDDDIILALMYGSYLIQIEKKNEVLKNSVKTL